MERVDLYRDQFLNTERSIVRGTPIRDGMYAMAVFACLFNAKGEMLIQRRHPEKKNWGGLWDVSVGGAVTSGEDSMTAICREISEELGLQLQPEKLTKTLSLYYDRMIHDFYAARIDVDAAELRLQPEEVAEAKWADVEEIHRMIEDRRFVPIYKEFVDLLFRMETKKGIL